MSDPRPAALPLGDELRPEARRLLTERGVERSFEPDAVLWRQGSPARAVYVVLQGEVKLVRSGEGRQHVIHRGGEGAILGEVPLFADVGYPATAIAVRRTRCLVVDRATLEAAMAADPTLARHLLMNLARRVHFLVQRLDQRSREDVRSRLLRHLETRQEVTGGGWFTLGMTQSELAEELGTVREVVVRTLAELRDAGVLERERGRYRIVEG